MSTHLHTHSHIAPSARDTEVALVDLTRSGELVWKRAPYEVRVAERAGMSLHLKGSMLLIYDETGREFMRLSAYGLECLLDNMGRKGGPTEAERAVRLGALINPHSQE